MGNKVKIAKEIAEIFDVEWRANFVAKGSTITTAWFENITMRLNDTKILEQDIDFNIYIEGKSKIRKAKKIAENAGFECRDEWFKPSKPDSKSDGGSTVKIPYFETVLLWSKNNYSDIEAIQDLGVELKENLKDIYEESTNFLDGNYLHFENSDFLNYGSNYNWLQSLQPIWGCLYPNISEIDWNLDDKEVRDQIFSELSIDIEQTYYENCFAIYNHLNVVSFQLGQFNSNLETLNVPLDKCKSIWEESWDEIDASKGVFEPIIARTSTKSISTIAGWAKTGKLDIDPIYQRDFVWKDPACRKLINSILMGVPLPSVILYEDKDGTYQIIDGKQRITSILRFMGALPEAKEFVMGKMSQLKISSTNEIVRTLEDNVLSEVILTGKNDLNLSAKDVPRYRQWRNNKQFGIIKDEEKDFMKRGKLPFNLGATEFTGLPDFEKLNGKFSHEIRNEKISLAGTETKISEVFETECDNYQIPLIIYDKTAKPHQIRRVFNRYNTQGQKLNPTEVNNAAYQSIDAMKFTMAMGRIRPSRGEEILPGMYNKIESDCEKLGLFL